ncbi:MAG: TIGR03621 family F420-dependent LLM class oxidoreductase, partial [Acidimicrobiia bacterium]
MSQDRKFRFGVMAPRTASAKQYRENARKAEDLGFTTLFVPDHFVDHPLSPIPAMAMAAEATENLRVGSLVLGNDYRHPVALAREAATLDLLTDGRLELGLGAGWMTADYEKAGMQLDRPGVRVDRLAESIAVLKGLFADGPFSFEGRYYAVTELDGQPKPVQRPHPPILVGGGAPRVLKLAGREADIIGINANLRSGEATNPDAARSMTGAAT